MMHEGEPQVTVKRDVRPPAKHGGKRSRRIDVLLLGHFAGFSTMVVLTVGALLLALSARVALAITESGTSGPDTLVGTNAADAIYGYGGNDKMDGRGGNDELRGGRGADRMEGGNGSDTAYAGRCADFVDVRGYDSRDYAYCGPGVDTANNMPGPGPADFFAADREESVYRRRIGGGALRTHHRSGVTYRGSGLRLLLASANPRTR